MTIHWCGTGLSAVPGLRKLIADGNNVCVWNRTVEKAVTAVGDVTTNIHAFDIASLESKLVAGGLGGNLHLEK